MTLRECVYMDQVCTWRFSQALELSKYLYRLEGNRQLMPFYTDHGPPHCERVEAIIDQILFGSPGDYVSLDHGAFIPSPEEAAYLLSAIWLHDIGMIYGIFPDETLTGLDIDWEQYRDKHELRSVEYICTQWHQNRDHWREHQQIALGQICIYHRRRHSLATMALAHSRGSDGQPIRFRELAALLRLGDACHVDQTRVPMELRNLFRVRDAT